MGAKQLTKDIQEQIIEVLDEYRALRVQQKNKDERREAGIFDLFPIINKDEAQEKRDELKVRQIDRVLQEGLDAIERKIIEEKYLSPIENNDINIYMELGIKRWKYYKKKQAAIINIAKALGII
ncbi:ArpU family phage packaging/lysis transcriptional regulator [Aneurinibacillus aneurinilyticus]|uniref:ArpU family phage packaging/lysis transcriptional regulator n=1 Tax=Aneurinibacillus aneurinilyticus TaxID=1391 RepID=UPI002E1C7C70|nr:ArpU family phage packaging/lysis transcriptional regulator [Aneurinibacillus aneurinilyticus]MED0670386.1 ArpU family phage packaging/lysis transcriptional regulator [Aneurinibacillus aneurinilyticus]